MGGRRLPDDDRAVMFVDGDCGVCAWLALRIAAAAERRGALRVVPIRSPLGDALLADLPPAVRDESWHVVDEGGVRRSAGAAFPEVLRRLPLGRPFAALAAAAPDFTDRCYRAAAARRSRWGRIVPRRASARARAVVAASVANHDHDGANACHR